MAKSDGNEWQRPLMPKTEAKNEGLTHSKSERGVSVMTKSDKRASHGNESWQRVTEASDAN